MGVRNDDILYLSRDDVEQACQDVDPLAAVGEAFLLHAQAQVTLPAEAYLAWTNETGHFSRSLAMPALLRGDVQGAGIKIINASLGNPEQGLARAHGLTMLFDLATARPYCILEGARISALRTAAVTALAVDRLAARPPRTVGIVGAGAIAHTHAELLLDRQPTIDLVKVYDLQSEAARCLARAFDRRNGARLEVTTSAREAVADSEVVILATTTTQGYLTHDWLTPGAVVCHVSLDDVLPDAVHRADLLVVDDWPLVRDDERRLLGRMYRAGLLVGPGEPAPEGGRAVDTTFGEILAGTHPGRSGPEDVVLFNPFGMALHDVALASHVHAVATQRGIGRSLPR